jgi:hypothetical protein
MNSRKYPRTAQTLSQRIVSGKLPISSKSRYPAFAARMCDWPLPGLRGRTAPNPEVSQINQSGLRRARDVSVVAVFPKIGIHLRNVYIAARSTAIGTTKKALC